MHTNNNLSIINFSLRFYIEKKNLIGVKIFFCLSKKCTFIYLSRASYKDQGP